MSMWISYAGSDSGELVEALALQLKTQCPTLEVNRYKKRVELLDRLSDSEQSETGNRADDDWPVVDQSVTTMDKTQEQFYLLPMEDLFELVVEIAFSSRVLVILSPAYFRSLPCLQELAALMCRKGMPLPLFILNGVTHVEIKQGKITLKSVDAGNDTTINLSAALADARVHLTKLNAFDFSEELSESAAAEYFQKLVDKNVPEVFLDTEADDHGRVTDESSATADLLTGHAKLHQSAKTIVSAVEGCFLRGPDSGNSHHNLRDADRQRYVEWFKHGFAWQLLETLKDSNANVDAEHVINQLIAEPAGMDRDISTALRSLNQSRQDTAHERELWNAGVSELAGLYALTLIDYEKFVELGQFNKGNELMFLSFFAGEFETSLRASIVNATLRDSMLRLMPSSQTGSSGELEAPGFSFSEQDSSASVDNNPAAREFVERLHSWVLQKTPDTCPKDNPSHSTEMSDRERQRLRGRIKKYQANHGLGSLILIVEKGRFSTGTCWWELWDEVHNALNDGALPHSKVKLQGIIATEQDSAASITMHPDHEERLIYIEDLLQSYYLT